MTAPHTFAPLALLTSPVPTPNSSLPSLDKGTRRKPGPQSHGSSLPSATPDVTPPRRPEGPQDRRAAERSLGICVVQIREEVVRLLEIGLTSGR
jgi:hypothetical protein